MVKPEVVFAICLSVFSLNMASADIMVMDPFARVAHPGAKAGAAFMVLHNTGDTDDRLVSVTTDIAARAELHTHIAREDGVMQMRKVEDGFVVPAGHMHPLARGGDHVMLMGLTHSLAQGDNINIILRFENAGEVVVTLPVDNTRAGPSHSH